MDGLFVYICMRVCHVYIPNSDKFHLNYNHDPSNTQNNQKTDSVKLTAKEKRQYLSLNPYLQDCEYILKQENEIERFNETRLQQSNLIKVQEDQIANLKNILNATIGVKIKYENIIKRLVETEAIRDIVLATIEQVQQHTPSTTALSTYS